MKSDYLIQHADSIEGLPAEDCLASELADMLLCQCVSCKMYQLQQEANKIGHQIYRRQMTKVKADAAKPFYEGWECP